VQIREISINDMIFILMGVNFRYSIIQNLKGVLWVITIEILNSGGILCHRDGTLEKL
jgi:hypothetical protein